MEFINVVAATAHVCTAVVEQQVLLQQTKHAHVII
jgi:hypothetical protein